MLRRFFPLLILAGIAAFALYWWLTVPQLELTAAPPPYTPNLANGENIFNGGGWSSCHSGPKQPHRHLLRPEHLARSGRRHRPMERDRFRQCGDARRFARGDALLPGIPLHL